MDKSREPLLKPGSLDLHLALRSHFGHYFLFWRASREYQFRKPQYCHNLSVGRVWVALICGLSPPQIKEAMTMVFDAFSRRKLHVPSSTNESRGPYCVCIRVVKLNLWLILFHQGDICTSTRCLSPSIQATKFHTSWLNISTYRHSQGVCTCTSIVIDTINRSMASSCPTIPRFGTQ